MHDHSSRSIWLESQQQAHQRCGACWHRWGAHGQHQAGASHGNKRQGSLQQNCGSGARAATMRSSSNVNAAQMQGCAAGRRTHRRMCKVHRASSLAPRIRGAPSLLHLHNRNSHRRLHHVPACVACSSLLARACFRCLCPPSSRTTAPLLHACLAVCGAFRAAAAELQCTTTLCKATHG